MNLNDSMTNGEVNSIMISARYEKQQEVSFKLTRIYSLLNLQTVHSKHSSVGIFLPFGPYQYTNQISFPQSISKPQFSFSNMINA